MCETFNKKCIIAINEQLGRYVKAAEAISPGECVLLEQPILIMADNGERRCNNCFKLAEMYCSICKITDLCLDCHQHNQYDCTILSSMAANLDVDVLKRFSECYGIIKCLLLQQNPETKPYFDLMLQAECHLEERRGSPIWSHYNSHIVDPILTSGIAKHLTHGSLLNEDFLQRLCALIDVNGFEIRAPDYGFMKGVYIQGALLSHDCTANTQISIDDKYCMKIYANCDIAAGETVKNCYTNVLLGTDERRRILQTGKYFHCTCKRCEDNTEFGSHLSSLICPTCLKGYMVKHCEFPQWQCLDCQHFQSTEDTEKLLTQLRAEILNSHSDIYSLEMTLQRLLRVLHPNHYMVIDVKQNIASILRTILNDTAQCPGRMVYERKIELCEDILKVLHRILPGTISRLKAIVLYELASTNAEYHRMRFQEKELESGELKLLLAEIEQMLRDSIRMLLYEPKDTPEGKLLQTMLQELKYLQTDMKMLT